MNIETFIIALGLALIIEGLIPALFPNKWKNYVLKVGQEPAKTIRSMGLIIMVVGTLLLYSFS